MAMFPRYRLPNEASTCPACASGSIVHLHFVPSKRFRAQGQHLSFVTGCRACGLVFIDPPRTDEQMAEYYAEDGGWNKREATPRIEREGPTRRPPDRDAGPGLAPAPGAPAADRETDPPRDRDADPGLTQAAIARFWHTAGRKALDFGCGTGRILDALQRHGFDTYGIDPATHDTVKEHAMIRGIPAVPTFDLVAAKHVLEHLADPLGVLRRLRQALHPGGLLALGVPDLWQAPVTG